MKNLIATTLFIAAILLSGCGKEAGKTTANVTILSGLAAVVPGQTGGTMLLGSNPQTGQSFSKVFDGAPIELQNGFWDFAVVSWDGNGADQVMQGITRCGIIRNFALTGGEQGVSLAISSATCADPFFGFDDTKEVTGEPLPVLPSTCTDERGVRETFDNYCDNSTTSAYRIILPEKRLDGSVGPGLQSICVSEDTPTTPELDSASIAIRIPIFAPTGNNPPLVIDLHDAPDCSDLPDRRIINNIYTGVVNKGVVGLNEQGSPTHNEVRVSKNPCTSPVAQNPSLPFSMDGGTTFALCNADQFVNHVPGNLAGVYKLYSDLDFSGQGIFSDPVVNADFTGRLDGRGYAIRNVSINQATANSAGLFKIIDGDGTLTGPESNIQDLVLENFDIVTSGSSNGALAGAVYWGSSISRVTLRNISMTINAAVPNHGGLVGYFVANTGGDGTGSFTRAYAIKAENITITTSANAVNIGGVVGQLNSSNELADVVVDGLTVVPNAGNPSAIGGLIGNQPNGRVFAASLTNISLGNTTDNLPVGANQVGGLSGLCSACEIRDSKAVAAIYGGGNEVGGLVGAVYDANLSNNVSIISIPIAPGGTGVGGHIGNISSSGATTFVEQSRSFGSINCATSNCGGFAGSIQHTLASGSVDLNENFTKVDVNSTTINVGGFAGFVNATNTGTISVIGNSAMPATAISGSASIGGFVGNVFGSTSVVADNIFVGSVNVSTGTGGGFIGTSDSAPIERNVAWVESSTGTLNSFAGAGINTATFTDNFQVAGATDTRATTLTTGEAATQASYTNFDFTVATGFWTMGITHPEIRAVKAISDVGGTYTGSNTDPIILTSPTQWNSIGAKPSLMNKVYRLGNTLDFGMGAFTPIGNLANPFVGKLQGNNQTIQNINYTDNVNTEPVGLFRVIGVDPDNGPTEIEHENPFNYDDKFSLIIRNVNIAKGTSISGRAGILAGVLQDDGATNPNNGQNHDWNLSVKIGGIEIYDSYVDGGKVALNSQVGGLVGLFTHTNGQSEIRDIKISNTEVYSGNQNGGTGGVFGRVNGPLNATATPSFRQFDGFILDGLTVQATGASADYVGGVVGFLGQATAFWEFMVVSNTNVTGAARVGGMFGDVGFNNSINQGSFVNGSVSGTTLVGGIAGNVGNSTVKGMLSKATVSASGTVAGCIAGQGDGGTNIILENSVGICPSVTASGSASYLVAVGLNTASPTVNNVYTGPSDEVLGAKFIYLTADEMLSPTSTAPVISAGDPWILEPGFEPEPFWFTFPEALER